MTTTVNHCYQEEPFSNLPPFPPNNDHCHNDSRIIVHNCNPTTNVVVDGTTAAAAAAPMLPLGQRWFRGCDCTGFVVTAVWPGLGLLGESYVLFSLGLFKPLWQTVFEPCWQGSSAEVDDYYTVCTDSLLYSLSYSVVLGVIAGMLLFGCFLADCMGRRRGSIATATLMMIGAFCLTGVALTGRYVYHRQLNNETDRSAAWLFRALAASLFVFGVGVGGEYPLAAASASERTMTEAEAEAKAPRPSIPIPAPTRVSPVTSFTLPVPTWPTPLEESDGLHLHDDTNNSNNNTHAQQQPQPQQHRGRQVQLVFTMQGVGILLNSVVFTVLMKVFGQSNRNSNTDAYNAETLLTIWQIVYALGALILTTVWLTRVFHLKESTVWQATQQQQQHDARKEFASTAVEYVSYKNDYFIPPPQVPTVVSAAKEDMGEPPHHTDDSSMQQQQQQQRSASAAAAAKRIPVNKAPPFSMPPPPPPITPLTATTDQPSSQQNDASSLEVAVATRYRTQHCPAPATAEAMDDPQGLHPLTRVETYNAVASTTLVVPTMGKTSSSASVVSTISSLSSPSVTVTSHNHNPYHHYQDDHDGDVYNMLHGPEDDDDDDDDFGCVTSSKNKYVLLLTTHYGVRLFAVSACWFLWDVAFYGNKLFQSTFLLALTGTETTTLSQLATAATLNSAVALAGYFGAAAIIDHPSVGRRKLQQWGYVLTGSLFVGVSFLFDHLSTAVLVTMYLGSSFFGQLGPNATTFLIPTEIFPTELRTVGHGIAAASGKLGALTASILFNYVSNDLDMFLLSGYASFIAAAVTFWLIPETTGLDLYENDRQWRRIVSGNRQQQYQGDPAFFSVYERHQWTRQKQRAAGNYLTSDLHDAAYY